MPKKPMKMKDKVVDIYMVICHQCTRMVGRECYHKTTMNMDGIDAHTDFPFNQKKGGVK